MLGRFDVVPVILLCSFLSGCAGVYLPTLPDEHPANVEAPQAPAYPESVVLAMEEPPPNPIPPEMKDGEEMEHMRHGAEGKEGAAPSEDTSAAAYSCQMHPGVSADAPGRCPKCNMLLKKKGGGDQ